MKPQLYILCVLCAFAVNTSFSQELSAPDQNTQLQALDKLIESQSATPTLEGVKLIFSSYSNGSPIIKQSVEKSIPRLKITDEILEWLRTDAAKSPNKDIRLLTLRLVSAEPSSQFNIDFSRIFLYDPDEKIRLENIKSLNRVSNPDILPLLIVALTDGYYPVRKTTLEMLAKYANYQAIEIIIKRYPAETSMTLQFDMEQILVQAYNISDNSVILLNYLTSDSPQVRALICRIIGKSTTINNSEALKKLKDDNAEVTASRDWALKQLQGPTIKVDLKPTGKTPIAPLANRFEPGRAEMLLKYNGDKNTEKAVQLGLEWLARNQEPDGSWNCAKHNPWSNKSPLPAFANEEELVDVSVTGLSLLCFLGDGSTHQSGLYQETFRKGLEFIKSAQERTGR